MSEEQKSQVPGKAPLSKIARERTLGPHQSIWPFALACALVILLMGVITQPIIFGIGAVAVVAAIIGWGLERR